MSDRQQVCQHIVSQLTLCGPVMARAMFGGYGLYCEGTMFALIADRSLYFKVDDDNRQDYERAGMQPFVYTGKGKPIAMSYYRLPEDVFENVEALAEWMDKARAAATRSKRPKRKTPAATRH